jgi:ribosome-interacting GTPase 1
MSKVATIHLIGFLVLLAFTAGCFYKFGIVATVNGKPIYRHSYIAQLQKQDKQTVLSQMVQDALIAGEAKNKGIVIGQEEIDKGLAAIEDQVKAQGTTLDEAMKAQGVTKEEVMSQIRTQKIAEALASPSAEITKEQIDAFLKENKAYLPTGKTDNELQMLAKEQLETQAKNTALSTWFSNLKSSAKIIYK